MDCITILARTVESAYRTSEVVEETVVPIDLIWQHITSLGLLEALTFISFGTVCLFYGWRVFKILVVISFALIGMVLGVTITERINGGNNQLMGGVIGLVAMAVIAVPLMRWAVSVLGAVAGGILTSGVWFSCGLSEKYIWAGALIGIVAGGMISFIIFRIAVILFSSLGGSALVSTGTLALLYTYPRTTEKIQELVFTERWFLPVVLMLPTVVGIILQHKFVKGSKDWNI